MTTIAAVMEKPFEMKTWHWFLLLVLGSLANLYIMQNFVLTREVYHTLMADQLEPARIDEYFTFMKSVSIWNYLIFPLILLIKVTFLALLFQTPLVFKFIDIPFKTLFRIMIQGSIVMLAASVVGTLWLMHFDAATITEAHLSFVPLSITNLLEYGSYPQQIFALLANINLFEAIWIGVVSRGFVQTEKLKMCDSVLLVMAMWTLMLILQWLIILYFLKSVM